MYKFIDLFSGIGGFHIGFEGIGECVYSCEWDEPARKTYSENFNTAEFDFDKDINDVDYKHIPDRHLYFYDYYLAPVRPSPLKDCCLHIL